jgi:hypothetical protein
MVIIYLIIVMQGGTEGGRFNRAIEFNTMAACEEAKAGIQLAARQWIWQPAIVCASKGKE